MARRPLPERPRLAVVAPILFYPFARTIWSAFDVGMTPLELKEIVEATDAATDAAGSDGSGPALPGTP